MGPGIPGPLSLYCPGLKPGLTQGLGRVPDGVMGPGAVAPVHGPLADDVPRGLHLGGDVVVGDVGVDVEGLARVGRDGEVLGS